jgi:transcriptional regulator with XRE-family HTH domain
MSKEVNKPYQSLGNKLRALREKRKESIEDASGAVELDPVQLQQIEMGESRPPEDVLHVLIHHFDLDDSTAEELWKLAGYPESGKPLGDNFQTDRNSGRPSMSGMPAVMIMPIDGRVVYSDSAHVAVNNHGVVMTFFQAGVDGNQIPVSRIGMSREHAESIQQLLNNCLTPPDPKQLTPPSDPSTKQQLPD